MKILQTKKFHFNWIALLLFAVMFSIGCDNGTSFSNDDSIEAFSRINKNIVNVLSASASSQIGFYGPEKTIDGNLDRESRWTGKGYGEWTKYDLGSIKNITSVEIFFYRGHKRSYSFSIEVSKDGYNWNEIVNSKSSGYVKDFEKFPFQNSYTRYVKIKGYGYSNPGNPTSSLKTRNEIVEVKINEKVNNNNNGNKPFVCTYGDGAAVYNRVYSQHRSYLERTWNNFGCDKIVEFSGIAQKEYPTTGSVSRICKNAARNEAGKEVASEKQKTCGAGDGFEDGFDAAISYCQLNTSKRIDMSDYDYMYSWTCDVTLDKITDILCPNKKYNDSFFWDYVDYSCY